MLMFRPLSGAVFVCVLFFWTQACNKPPASPSESSPPPHVTSVSSSQGAGSPGAVASSADADSITARIRRHRTSPLRIRVLNAGGAPMAGAAVQVQQLRHAYRFGTAVNTETFFGIDGTAPADRALYRQTIRSLFNAAVFEGGMKWKAWSNPDRRRRTLTLLEWLHLNDLAVRGHALVWGGWDHTPKPLHAPLKASPDSLRDAVQNHMDQILPVIGDRVVAWDVVNEPFYDDDYTDRLGEQAIDRWFGMADAAAPTADLYLNEAGILRGDSRRRNPRMRGYRALIHRLQARGVPLEGIGMQGHFQHGDVDLPADTVLAVLNRFASAGLPITITEFDVRTDDEAASAALTRRVLRTAYSHPATEGFLMWGFWDGRHWRNDAPLFNTDWSLKPSGQAWMDLVYDAWWTDVQSRTDANGAVRVRATHGTHQVSVRRPDGSMHTAVVSVGPDATTATIQVTG